VLRIPKHLLAYVHIHSIYDDLTRNKELLQIVQCGKVDFVLRHGRNEGKKSNIISKKLIFDKGNKKGFQDHLSRCAGCSPQVEARESISSSAPNVRTIGDHVQRVCVGAPAKSVDNGVAIRRAAGLTRSIVISNVGSFVVTRQGI